MPKWLPAAAAIAPDKVLFASLFAYNLSSKTSILSLVLSSSFFLISTSSFASRTALAAAAACRFHLHNANCTAHTSLMLFVIPVTQPPAVTAQHSPCPPGMPMQASRDSTEVYSDLQNMPLCGGDPGVSTIAPTCSVQWPVCACAQPAPGVSCPAQQP